MAMTEKQLGVIAVIGGAEYVEIERTSVWNNYEGKEITSVWTYQTFKGEGLEQLNNLRLALEYLARLDEDSEEAKALFVATGSDVEDLIERFEEEAGEVAEDLEIAFIYQGASGTREYTPAAFWSASGGCEWEESAQYGSDYGWNV